MPVQHADNQESDDFTAILILCKSGWQIRKQLVSVPSRRARADCAQVVDVVGRSVGLVSVAFLGNGNSTSNRMDRTWFHGGRCYAHDLDNFCYRPRLEPRRSKQQKNEESDIRGP